MYSFSWMGRPVIQLPEDMLRIQEVIYQIKPDVLIETGVAHGGSLIFYASLFKTRSARGAWSAWTSKSVRITGRPSKRTS